MNNLDYKNPDNLKTDIDQLIDFKGEEDILRSSPKAKDPDFSQLNVPSKYATILVCSFEEDQKTGLDVKILPQRIQTKRRIPKKKRGITPKGLVLKDLL